jgi:hypothetical protein
MLIGNNALADFTSVPTWVQDGEANWVNKTEGTDQDYDSIGCGMAFLSWLQKLGHALPTIAQEMVKLGNAGTLEALYANTTGDAATHAWPKFRAALAGARCVSDHRRPVWSDGTVVADPHSDTCAHSDTDTDPHPHSDPSVFSDAAGARVASDVGAIRQHFTGDIARERHLAIGALACVSAQLSGSRSMWRPSSGVRAGIRPFGGFGMSRPESGRGNGCSSL